MSDIPRLAEQYSAAVADGQTRDVVGSVGYAGRQEIIGALLWRVLHGGDLRCIPIMRIVLHRHIEIHARRKNWRAEEIADAPDLSDRVLRWYLNNTCPACHGRRYEPVPGVDRVLSDKPCPACHGYGRTAIEKAAPIERIGRAKEIATMLDIAEQRMSDAVRKSHFDE